MTTNPQKLPVLARNVRLLRRYCGLTQQQLADRCQLSRTTILNIESGNHSPTFETIELLAKGLEQHLWLLLEDLDGRSTTTRFLAEIKSAISRASLADRERIAALAMRVGGEGLTETSPTSPMT
jgi:transcriptional regulator with XRE-family HTH domain